MPRSPALAIKADTSVKDENGAPNDGKQDDRKTIKKLFVFTQYTKYSLIYGLALICAIVVIQLTYNFVMERPRLEEESLRCLTQAKASNCIEAGSMTEDCRKYLACWDWKNQDEPVELVFEFLNGFAEISCYASGGVGAIVTAVIFLVECCKRVEIEKVE